MGRKLKNAELATVEPGKDFTVAADGNPKQMENLRASAYDFGRRHDKRFKVSREEGGFRVARVS